MKERLTSANIRLEFNPYINYASTLTGTSFVNALELHNDDEEDWHDLIVSLSGDMLLTTEARLSLVPRGETVSINTLDISPDLDKLRSLTESVDTQLHLIIKTERR